MQWVMNEPFSEILTTGLACKKLGRQFIGVEINKQYIDMPFKD